MADEKDLADEAGGDSVRADVLAAFEKHNVPTEQEWKLPTREADAPSDTSIETPVETDEQKAARSRDERGRFAKAAAPEDSATQGKPAVAKQTPDQDTLAKPTVEPSKAGDAPASWSGDAKTEWSKLPTAIQTAVLKREREIDEGGRRWSEEKRRYEDTLAPVRATAQRHGLGEAEAIQKLLSAQDYLERDPVNAVLWLAKSYGVDLKQLTGAPETGQAPRVDTRTIQALQQVYGEVNSLKQYVAQREEESVQQELKGFATEHPHYEEVRKYMGRLLDSGAAQSLQDAYDQACWATPSVREKLLADQKAETDRKQKEQSQQQVQKARRGAISINGAPNGNPGNAPKDYDSVRSAVEAAWAQHAR